MIMYCDLYDHIQVYWVHALLRYVTDSADFPDEVCNVWKVSGSKGWEEVGLSQAREACLSGPLPGGELL